MFNVRFQTFFFFGENLQGSKKIHSGLLRFPSSLPCSQGGPTFYMQKLHSNLKHLQEEFLKSVNICFVAHYKTTRHMLEFFLVLKARRQIIEQN